MSRSMNGSSPSSGGSGGHEGDRSSPPRSHRTLRALAVGSTGATVALITVGALVRATGSGEGCPGWPRCFGRLVPPFTYHPGVSLSHALIEYSHRLTASVVFVLILALAAVAWRRYRDVPRVFRPSMAAVALWLFQAVLGGLVVKLGLPAWLVTVHLATAMLFLGALVFATVAAYSVEAPSRPARSATARLALGCAVSVLALIVVGGLVRGEGAGLAFPDWPLMGGRAIPRLGSLGPALQLLHRLAALATGLLLVGLVRRTRRERPLWPAVAALPALAAALFLVQALIGAANVWTRLAAPAVVAHVAGSSLVWGAVVAVVATSRLALRAGPRPPAGEVSAREALVG